MSYYNINTTQNVELEFQIASVGDRILAYFIDLLIIILYYVLVAVVIGQIGLFDDPSPWLLLFLAPGLCYSLLCEIFLNGQSFGKMIMKIRVLMENGDELTLGACFIRWIFRLIDLQFSGLVALLTIIIRGKGQRLGDMAAGTAVLKTESGSKLEETIYERIPEYYKPSFPEVDQLSDSDVQTIKEVLVMALNDKEYENGAPHPLLMKTKNVVEKKIKVKSTLPSRVFLQTILKDYNYYHQ